jgi:hypothetical protein
MHNIGDHHVEALAAGQGGADERAGQVQAATAGLEHALDQVAHLRAGEDGGGQLRRPAGHEDLRRAVDPDLLDRRVVEVRLQGPEAGDRVHDGAGGGLDVVERRQETAGGPLGVVADGLGDEPVERGSLADGVEPPSAHELAHLLLEDRDALGVDAHDSCHACPLRPAPAAPSATHHR